MLPYIQIARPDHWFKNVFMIFGMVLAFFYAPDLWKSEDPALIFVKLFWGLAAVCLIVSSNYVINEILDAPTDKSHPEKKERPIPSGKVWLPIAYAEWVILGILGLAAAYPMGSGFFFSALALLIMGMVYNIPPVRSKEWVYLDVLSESINNPLRLLLGWYLVLPNEVPPMSLLISYWMVGAFFMATKRYAEYRWIADSVAAAKYRKSFRYYNETNLLVSMFVYAIASALFLGIFIVRYRLELILSAPFLAGFYGWYLYVGLKPNSAVQHPERLYRERGLMIYLVFCLALFVVLMFVDFPNLYDWFNVEPSKIPALWSVEMR
ncbi:MAG: UbiA prenyltransferase family protein [Planctomycetia bacterium]|nr:UbiA prenyltransferase family protein [Planctomycetia bacterium]